MTWKTCETDEDYRLARQLLQKERRKVWTLKWRGVDYVLDPCIENGKVLIAKGENGLASGVFAYSVSDEDGKKTGYVEIMLIDGNSQRKKISLGGPSFWFKVMEAEGIEELRWKTKTKREKLYNRIASPTRRSRLKGRLEYSISLSKLRERFRRRRE